MTRTPWSRLVYFGFQSLLQRFAIRSRRPLRLRRREQWTLGPVAADVCEPRQLLSSISAVSPNQGSTSGGTTVTIMGSGFQNVMGVEFGSTMASSYQVLSSSAISAVAPAHYAGLVDIQVMAMTGNSPITTVDQFSYTMPGPQVTGVSPNAGSAAGGNSVSIAGSGFTSGVSAVLFGSTNASSFSVMGDGTITAMAPAHAAGNVDVIVVTAAGTSAVNAADHYAYAATGPSVSSVSPGTGTGSGGTSVTITGTGFSGVTQVTFGGTNAGSFTVNSQTSLTAVAPAHTPGTVDVVVATSGGASGTGSSDHFVYTAPVIAPTVTGLGMTAGTTAGGTQVVIMGTNFTAVSGVMFGGAAAASYTLNSSTSITAVTPAESAGVVDVSVVNSAGTSLASAADQFAFQSPAPVVAYLGTTTGTTAGGTPITISGSNFFGAASVYFGTVPAASFLVNSPNSITAYAPQHAAGAVDVTVRNSGGTSTTSAGDQYTFVTPGALPTVSGLSAATGPTGGGTAVIITGTNFTNVTAVSFGNVAAGNFAVQSATSILAQSPAGSGTVDVTVTTTSGISATSSSDQFGYSGSGSGGTSGTVPVVVGLSTASGSTAGGTSVMIVGSGMLGVTGVYFGPVAASSFSIISDGAVTAVAPAVGQVSNLSNLSEPVDVTVTSAAGPSQTSPADQFTFIAAGDAPTICGLDVTHDSTAGGAVVTISGTNFSNATGVNFGSIAATRFLVASSGSIVAVAPAAIAAGTVDITVATPAGTTAASPADQFSFVPAPTSASVGSPSGAPAAAPVVTGLSANSGTLHGGDTVIIRGANLADATAVWFGHVAARSFVINADGTITVVTPVGYVFNVPVDVTVQTPSGTSATSAVDQYTFAAAPPPPTVSSLSPAIGSTTGGAAVTITGTNFTQVTGVRFGQAVAASWALNADGTLSAVAPGELAGSVDVTVTTRGGTSLAVAADQFTFSKSFPVVTALSVSSGVGVPTGSGGDSVTLYGRNLATAMAVFFDGIAATSFVINDDGTIIAVAPPVAQTASLSGPVTVDVTVQTPLGTSARSTGDQFQYVPAAALPTVASLGTTSGPAAGGGQILITGTNFTGVTGVFFGSIASTTFHVLSPTLLMARVPSGAQAASLSSSVDITVTSSAGTSAATATDVYTYTAPLPAIQSLSATSGYSTGGETISIYGGNFTGATAVLFGSVAAASFTVASDGLITAVAPSSVGYVFNVPVTVDITVQTPIGASTTGPQDQFTFTPAGAAPTVTALSASTGSTYGGQALTITGTNFTDVSGVSFGAVAATSFTVVSSTTIRVVAPAVAVGTCDVRVTTPAGTSSISTADEYQFTVSRPAVTALSAASGFTFGGDSVTIEGSDLSQASAVYFGTTAATFIVNADGSLTAVVPAAAAGNAAVSVVTPGGTSAANAAAQFTLTPSGALPTVTALGCSCGVATGGQTITVTGTNFTDVTSVNFGSVATTAFTVVSPTSLLVVTPAVAQAASLSGPVDVTVTTPSGTSAKSPDDQFTFQAPVPVVTGLSASSGFSDGGETVVISGINLAGTTAVFFGTTPAAAFTENADGTIAAVTPAVAQAASLSVAVDVTIQTSSGTSAVSRADLFTVIPAGALPTVAALNGVPSGSGGPTAGGQIVTITGTNFTDVSGVFFGGIAASKFVVDSPTRITAFAPRESAGTVDVIVTTPSGSSPTTAVDLYTFTAPAPKISGLSAASGFSSGGDSISIQGSNLADATAVYFGSVAAPSFTVNLDGSITAVVPSVAQAASVSVPVRVVTPSGTTGDSTAAQFTFTPAGTAPAVSGLSVSGGSTAGGQMVIISGSNFTDVSSVKFGDQAAALFYVVSPTSIVALSPRSDAGSSSVTVTSTAGSSASSSASAYAASTPTGSVSGGTSGAGSTGTGTFGSTATPPASYTVVPWAGGHPGQDAGLAFELGGLGANPTSGLLTSPTIPQPPLDPGAHPVFTMTMSGDITNPSMSWTETDAGTNVMSLAMTTILPNDGGTMITFLSLTMTFTYSAGGSSSGGSSSGYAHLDMTTTSVDYAQFTAADGTGSSTTNTSTEHSVIDDTYSSSPSSSSAEYFSNSDGTASFAEHQEGGSALVAGGTAVADDSGSSVSNSYLQASLSGGVTIIMYSDSEAGSDNYRERDTLRSAAATAIDGRAGDDNWYRGNSGSYRQNADGTSYGVDEHNTTSSGRDLYSDLGTRTVTSAAVNANGGTLLIDVLTTSDIGSDQYSASSSGNSYLGENGALTWGQAFGNTDAGSEEVKSSDQGLVVTRETDADGGSVVASDTFRDSNDDQSRYHDGDAGSDVQSAGVTAYSSGGNASEVATSQLESDADDSDTFTSGDTAHVAVTSIAPAGAVTTVTITANDSDNGTTRAHDRITDDETLPTASSGETDDFTFDDSASEEDTARAGATIDISVVGRVSNLSGPDVVDLTEHLTLNDVTKTEVGIDDPGTEDDTPTGDSESDQVTEESDVTDNLSLVDKLHAVETRTASDGTVTETDVDRWAIDNFRDDQKDTLGDRHSDNSSNAFPVGDDQTFDDLETDTATVQGGDVISVSTYGPVTVLNAVGQPGQTGTRFTLNVVADDYQGTQTETREDNGEDVSQTPETGPWGGGVIGGTEAEHDTQTDSFAATDSGDEIAMSIFNETLTDPTTGVKTTIGTDNFVFDKFQDGEKDNAVDKHTSRSGSGSGQTSGGDDVTAGDMVQTADETLSGDDVSVSIVGSPSAGVTENISSSISSTGNGYAGYQNVDQAHDVTHGAAEIDQETDEIDQNTSSQETIGLTGNTTVTTIDPTTGLTTVDTRTVGGKINVGDEHDDQSTDLFTLGQQTDPPGEGEDDITDHKDDQESINGTVNSTDTVTVTGTMPDGTVTSSTDTVKDKATVNAYTDDNKRTIGTDEATPGGQLVSDSSQTTDNTSDDANVTDTRTDSVQATISTTDPTTGLQVTFNLQDSSGDTTTETDHGNGTENSTYCSGLITPGIAPTGTTTDTKSGENDLSEHDLLFDHAKLTATVQGTDSKGDQVNVQETITLDDGEVDNSTNDDTQKADGTNAAVTDEHSSANAQITDRLKETVITVDPATGVRTSTTFNDLSAVVGNDTNGGGVTDNGSDSTTWSMQETTTQTNPDGTPVAAPATDNEGGSDTQTWANGVTTDQGSSTPAASVAGGNSPAITSVVTASGTTAQGGTNGGDVVVITGTGFSSDSQVSIGGTAAPSEVVVSSTTIIAVTPAHTAGAVDVAVSNAAGPSATSSADQFDYAVSSDDGRPAPAGIPSSDAGELIRQIVPGQVIRPLSPQDIPLILKLAVYQQGYYAGSTITYLGAGKYLVARLDGVVHTVNGPQPLAEIQNNVRAEAQSLETKLSLFPSDANMNRIQGASEVMGAIGSVPVILLLEAAPTGASQLAGGVLAFYAFDHANNGVYMIIWGTHRDTMTTQLIAIPIQELGGLSQDEALNYARYGDAAVGVGLNVTGGVLAARNVRAVPPSRTPHGNSLEYVGETHVYRIKGPNGTHKIGESMQGVRVRDGASIRGEAQARQLMKETGDFYKSDIRRTFADKALAREYETRLIERFRSIFGDDTLPGNLTNR